MTQSSTGEDNIGIYKNVEAWKYLEKQHYIKSIKSQVMSSNSAANCDVWIKKLDN